MFNSLKETKKNILKIRNHFEQSDIANNSEITSFLTALVSICDIAVVSESKKNVLGPDEITDIGDQAFALIDNVVYHTTRQNPELQQQMAQIALTITHWVVSHDGILSNIQSVVDALAHLANTIQHKTVLTTLAFFMTQVAHACNDEIIHDLDNANPSRPWRVLNLNRGIVATRSLDIDVMNAIFPELIEAIPMDAPGFFKEGMSEMLRLNYPKDVITIMQDFSNRTKLPAVH